MPRSSEQTSKPSSTLRRITHTRPGYDCIEKPCGVHGCGTRPGSSHGRHSDEWWYVVTDGAFALSLRVFTNVLNNKPWPPGKAPGGTYPMGADLSGHTDRATSEDDIREGSTGDLCEYIDGGRCWTAWTSGIAASEFVKENAVDIFEQPDAFWRALESRWREIRDHVEENRPRVRQCACCAGSGVVNEETVSGVSIGDRPSGNSRRSRR